ncbi:hypothetical protein DXG03_007447 [Asterophora parasitica]|uniref:Uncharacterized protein n=1 Tax=Asterophora parasitica TaxID=117018 RepID=A0A9P7KDI9_9AGAR|nr:hypothetical protein DXG03_007447 [Asterophora parasitica]
MTIDSSSGLFYAYAKSSTDDWSARFSITFASRDVADTWYRLITDSVAAGYTRFAGVKRVSPQFYTHADQLTESLNDPRVAERLRGQMFFTLLHDKGGRDFSHIPISNLRDHLSGDSFYLRSSSQPDTYWWYNPSTRSVMASRENRSTFTIALVDEDRAPGTVMIGSDYVHITADEFDVHIGFENQQSQLWASASASPIKFSSFQNRAFKVNSLNVYKINYHLEGPRLISATSGRGERWELV